MAFDSAGRLWVAASEGDAIVVFESNGSIRHVLDMGPSFPTNLCFGGSDLTVLVVTAPKGGRVLAADVECPGIALLTPPTRAAQRVSATPSNP
jgi:gluconolactonase